MTKIYLIRHGQSLANVEGRFAGQTDVGLSELGVLQAKAVGEYLKDKGIDTIYSSPLKRASSTAEPLSKLISKPVILHQGIIEIFAGKWENLHFSQLEERFPKSYRMWLTDIGNSHCDGGESMKQVRERMVSAVSELAEREEGKTIALFIHAGCMRAFLTHCLNMPVARMQELSWVPNASVTEVHWEDGNFDVVEMGYHEHLGEMVSNLPSNV